MLIELARYPEAARLLERNANRVLPGVTTIHLNVTLAHLHVQTGDLAAADRELAIARAEASGLDDAQFTIDIHSFGTEVALWGGDPATALAIARDGFDRLVDMDDAIILGQLALPAVRAAADLAVMARAARHEAAAASAVAATHDIIGRYEAAISRLAQPDDLAAREIGWRMALCAAELARASGADDRSGWDAVRPALTARPAPFLEAYVLWRTAEALAGSGEMAAAGEPLREGYAIAASIGAGQLVARLEGLGRRLRVDLTPGAAPEVEASRGEPPPAAEPPGPDDPFGLTVREREVLALVSEGYTNRRIADTLFISESTAGVHVSHILAKLGVETRTEAAAVAVRLGLDREPGR
jgi:DNA-binding CsgD family transcriptional regulator